MEEQVELISLDRQFTREELHVICVMLLAEQI
jgi:hypothetical protein